ncbi:MAG: tetratricopeptide repeat protein [Bacteroidota bacterium]
MTLKRLFTLISYPILGLLAFGAFLDAISNTFSVITPTLTYIISGFILIALIFDRWILKKINIPWDKGEGQKSFIRKLGIKTKLALLGVLGLVWLPLFVDQSNSKGEQKEVSSTKVFKQDSTYNILLLPFGKDGICLEENNQYHKQVHKRILAIKKQQNLNIEVFREDSLNCDWVDADVVRNYGKEKDANLVIYGNYEERCDDTTLLNVRYVLVDSINFNPDIFIEGEAEYTLHDKVSLSELRRGNLTGKPEDVLYWALALQEFSQKDFRTSISYLKLIKEREERPDYYIVYQLLGSSYFYLDQHKKAIEYYTLALQLNPRNAGIYTSRGSSQMHLKEYEKAIEDLSMAIKLFPNLIDAYLNRGVAYQSVKQSDKAIGDFSKVIEMDPSNGFAYSKRGSELMKLNYLLEALRDFEKTLQLRPKNLNAYMGSGMIYKKMKRHKDAIKRYDKAIELYPQNKQLFLNRGICYTESKNIPAARTDFETVLSLDPRNASAFEYLGDLLSMEGKQIDALSFYDKSIEINPLRVTPYHKRGSVHFALGNYEQALVDLNMAITYDPEFTVAYYNRAMVYLQLGDSAKAEADFQVAGAVNKELGSPITSD